MTDFCLELSNSYIGRHEIEADKRAETVGNSTRCWRMAQGALSLAAVIQTVVLLAAAILILPFSTFVICSPQVRNFDVRLLNSLAASAFAIIAPWKQAIGSCCCARDRGQVITQDFGKTTRVKGPLTVTRFTLDGTKPRANPDLPEGTGLP